MQGARLLKTASSFPKRVIVKKFGFSLVSSPKAKLQPQQLKIMFMVFLGAQDIKKKIGWKSVWYTWRRPLVGYIYNSCPYYLVSLRACRWWICTTFPGTSPLHLQTCRGPATSGRFLLCQLRTKQDARFRCQRKQVWSRFCLQPPGLQSPFSIDIPVSSLPTAFSILPFKPVDRQTIKTLIVYCCLLVCCVPERDDWSTPKYLASSACFYATTLFGLHVT